ncbi:hypothetical protein DWB85_12815 [Seongchinamella sediminis]|uniref:Cysteine-rich CWC n=1 Tax=Seongchinamella sediminis TaxID=2283635 RepID=A0A3L7DZI3_9GAMM|nr:cysteine-rich CWC family protein [Seongchinamella sediminis]RLQ21401.1 hypothetical protein DWB85_12815 [Seongchinamella sediminis]
MDNENAGKCPLCGHHNQCATAAGKAPESCWCMTVELSAAALAAVPEAERGVRCICPACGTDKRREH